MIVGAAVAVADSEGLGAVSLRRVADDLHTRATSLYTYLDSREDLYILMINEVLAERLAPDPLPTDWRDAVRVLARRERAALLRHPWQLDIVPQPDPTSCPNGLRFVNQLLTAVASLDTDPQRRWEALRVITAYVIGFASSEIRRARNWRMAPAEMLTTDLPPLAFSDAGIHSQFASLFAPGELGNLVTLRDAGVMETADSFDRGLEWLLAGIQNAGGAGTQRGSDT